MARTRIAEFGTIQKLLAGATVTVYVADTSGENTGVKASLYQASTGPALRGNPQVLDEDGKLVNDCWVEDYVMAEISNISERTQRELKKIRVNPLQYPLPLTSSSLNVSDASDAAATAVAAAAVSTAQAGISTTNAGLTAADRVQTGLDRVQTGSDLTNTTAQAVIASNAATAATAAAAGMNWKRVRVATTAPLPTNVYANGASGVGATLTASANGAFPSQDGVAVVVGNRIGVINEAAQLKNGVYTLTNAGSAGTPWVMTRATDADAWAELVSQVILVEEGATQAELAFICTVNTGGTIGTTAVVWGPFTMPIADGSVSTTAKIANGIITYAKMAAAALATTASDLFSGGANLLVTCASFKLWQDTYVKKRVLSFVPTAGQTTQVVNYTFKAGYNYVLVCRGISFALAASLAPTMEMSQDNGATYDTAAGDYIYKRFYGKANVLGDSGSFTAAVTNTYSVDANIAVNTTIELFEPMAGGTNRPAYTSKTDCIDASTYAATITFGRRDDPVSINKVRLVATANWNATGTITLYEEPV